MHNLSDDPTPENASNVERHELLLPDYVRPVQARLARLGIGAGADFLWKAFLPWLLPKVDRCITVDLDAVFMSSPCGLVDQFFGNLRPRSEAIGWVQDVAGHRMYVGLPVQPNGGVVAMDLAVLRESATYLLALERYNQTLFDGRTTSTLGTLGDQTLYANLAMAMPELFYKLPCGLNRQLSTHYPVWHSRYACSSCDVLHFNGVCVKWMADELHRRGGEPCVALRAMYGSMSESHRYVVQYTIGDGSCCGIRLKGPVGSAPRLKPLPNRTRRPEGTLTV